MLPHTRCQRLFTRQPCCWLRYYHYCYADTYIFASFADAAYYADDAITPWPAMLATYYYCLRRHIIDITPLRFDHTYA